MMAFPKPTARKKYSNVKTNFHGYAFDSKLEAAVFGTLKLLQAAGEIRDLRVKPNVRLTEADILMIPDFSAFDRKLCEVVFFEAKGFETEVWRLKRKLWTVYGPGRLRVYKGTYKKLFIAEEIVPRLLKQGEFKCQ